MKSWHPSLPSFNTFVIVFYFLFRRLAKRDAAAYADPDVITRYARDLIEEEGDEYKANIEQPQKAYANPGYEQPAYKYVQFKLNYSGISCSYTLCLIR